MGANPETGNASFRRSNADFHGLAGEGGIVSKKERHKGTRQQDQPQQPGQQRVYQVIFLLPSVVRFCYKGRYPLIMARSATDKK